MNSYATEIRALDPISGEMRTFAGPHIEAESEQAANDYCQTNGLGYCLVTGMLA